MPGKATIGERGAAPQLCDSLVFMSLVREGDSHGTVQQAAASLVCALTQWQQRSLGWRRSLGHTEAGKSYPGTPTRRERPDDRNRSSLAAFWFPVFSLKVERGSCFDAVNKLTVSLCERSCWVFRGCLSGSVVLRL